MKYTSNAFRNHRRHRTGSALLIAILLITALLATITTLWRSSTLMLNVAITRVAYEQQHAALDGATLYATTWVQHHFDELMTLRKKNKTKFSFKTHEWHITPHVHYAIDLSFEVLPERVLITTKLTSPAGSSGASQPHTKPHTQALGSTSATVGNSPGSNASIIVTSEVRRVEEALKKRLVISSWLSGKQDAAA